MSNDMISIRDAAKELKVTPRQLLKWVQKNKIFATLTPDWNILIPRREFERLKITLGVATKQIGPCTDTSEPYLKNPSINRILLTLTSRQSFSPPKISIFPIDISAKSS